MKKTIQAIPVEIVEINGLFYYRLTIKEGVRQSWKGWNSETKALMYAEKAIENYWYVGH